MRWAAGGGNEDQRPTAPHQRSGCLPFAGAGCCHLSDRPGPRQSMVGSLAAAPLLCQHCWTPVCTPETAPATRRRAPINHHPPFLRDVTGTDQPATSDQRPAIGHPPAASRILAPSAPAGRPSQHSRNDARRTPQPGKCIHAPGRRLEAAVAGQDTRCPLSQNPP